MLWNSETKLFHFHRIFNKNEINRQSEPPPPHLYIFANVKSCKVWPDFLDLGKHNMLMLSKELKLLDKTQKRRKSKHFFMYIFTCCILFCNFVVVCWLLSFKISLGNKIKLSNCLDQDNFVGPDLDPNFSNIISRWQKLLLARKLLKSCHGLPLSCWEIYLLHRLDFKIFFNLFLL